MKDGANRQSNRYPRRQEYHGRGEDIVLRTDCYCAAYKPRYNTRSKEVSLIVVLAVEMVISWGCEAKIKAAIAAVLQSDQLSGGCAAFGDASGFGDTLIRRRVSWQV
jgi:hypothetical protein